MTRLWRWVARSLLVLGTAGLVAGGLRLAVGAPSRLHEYSQDEVRRFAPTWGHGLGQLGGEAFLLLAVAVVAHRYLRVHL